MISSNQNNLASQRWEERTAEHSRNLNLIGQKRFFEIDDPQRVKKFLSRRGYSDTAINNAIKDPGRAAIESFAAPSPEDEKLLGLERVMGTNDLVNISFLEKALRVAATVGRIWINNSTRRLGYGTGFMVSPTLMLTNNHVLPSKEIASYSFIQFKYYIDINGILQDGELFKLRPDQFFATDKELDFTLVGVEPVNAQKTLLKDFGWNSLSKETGKTIISQWVNIIQHPSGDPQQVGLRENQVIDVLDDYLHYRTDTAPGSSGSLVCNEQWEVVALHHAAVWEKDAKGRPVALDGSMWSPAMGENNLRWIGNEGVRISRVLATLEAKHLSTAAYRKLYDEIYTFPDYSKKNELMSNNNNSNTSNVNGIVTGNAVTWTIPLSVTVQLGNPVINGIPATPPAPDAPSGGDTQVPPDNNTPPETTEEKILTAAQAEFSKNKNVLSVRLGYVFVNGEITQQRAIVVTVPKLSDAILASIPQEVMGYKVEVTGPTLEDLIILHKGVEAYESLLEPSGLEIKYTDPGFGLEKVTEQMSVTAHVSPEEGWNNLSRFLAGTTRSLTVAMYDFGAPHIIETIGGLKKKTGFKKLKLVIQPGESVGSGTKADDWKDQEVIDNFSKVYKNRFEYAWVKIGAKNGWVSSSYHIKVAVRDSKMFWLSSGNWQSSNQPAIDSLPNQDIGYLLRNYNREWHVVVENEALAKKYEQYINYDLENNAAPEESEAALLAEDLYFLVPDTAIQQALEAQVVFKKFQPFKAKRAFTVTPLLTPDNFLDQTIALVKSAKHELLIQNQTFNAPKPEHAKLEQLIKEVLKKQKQGVDVKIIFRVVMASDARKNLEKLVEKGFDPAIIKMQKNCHTKGVIVDGKKVMLGSQNWSNDGVSVNRDASLIFEDQPMADYFRKIFMHDWDNLAKSSIGREAAAMEVTDLESLKITDANGEEKIEVPEGMTLMSWKDIRETL